ncbi:hypothetical protein D3C78_1519940 [compost metagenome]
MATTGQVPASEVIAQALARIGDDPVKQQMQLAAVTRCLQQALMTPEAMIDQKEYAA